MKQMSDKELLNRILLALWESGGECPESWIDLACEQAGVGRHRGAGARLMMLGAGLVDRVPGPKLRLSARVVEAYKAAKVPGGMR